MIVEITIPGVPVAQHRPRFARRGKFVQTYSDQETDAGRFIALARNELRGCAFCPTAAPLHVQMEFYLPWPASIRPSKRTCGASVHCKKPDLSNMVKFAEDCLNGILWADDRQIHTLTAAKRYDDRPRTEIWASWEVPA